MDKSSSSTSDTTDVPCDVTMKIALIGDSAVGKTCLLNRYVQGNFSAEFYTTIGIDYRTKIEDIDGSVCKLDIWDTAGQERFRAITKSYLRDVAGIFLVFDITNRSSFANIPTWVKQIEDGGSEDVCCMLIGTHGDLMDKREVSDEEIKESADSLKYGYYITSALDGTNVDVAFKELARLILSKSKKEEKKIKGSVNLEEMPKEKSGCAC